MQELVRDLVQRKLSRRGFLGGMVAAGYSAAAARSALASVSPFLDDSPPQQALTRSMTGTGGALLAEQIIETGAKYFFVANASGLGALCDSLVERPQIQLIQATHEGQVVAIADGYAKASGKIGFGMYSRVGLPHSSANMYNSMKDRTSVVLLSDHADTGSEGVDGHEDIDDWLEPVKQYTKWRWVAHQAERIPEWVRQACKVSTVMPGGPCYVRIPRDLMYRDNVTAAIFKGEAFRIPMEIRPDVDAIQRAARAIWEASSPLLLVGPEVSQCDGRKDVVKLAELLGMPVVQHRSYYADFPTSHPLHVGELGEGRRFPEKYDCLINFGARPSRAAGAAYIHASVEPLAIGRNTPLTAGLLGDLGQTARDLAEAIKSLVPAGQLKTRAAERLAAATAYTSKLRQTRVGLARRSKGAPVPWQRLMVELNDQLDKNAVIVEEIGTESKVLNFFDFADDAKLKIGRTEGRSLGWGTGAAAGVQLALPDRQVVNFQGDGGFLFGQTDSLWTYSRYDLPIMTVIFNNQSYEEVRWNIMGREGGASGKAGRDYINYLGDPDVDFTKLAAAYNIDGAVVKNTEELGPAIQRGLKIMRDGRPFMLDVRVLNTGAGADVTWYPKFSLAKSRTGIA